MESITVTGSRLELTATVDAGWLPPRELAAMTRDEFQHFLGFAPQYIAWLREARAGMNEETYQARLVRELEAQETRVRAAATLEAGAALAQKDTQLAVVGARADALRAQLEDSGTARAAMKAQLDDLYRGIVGAKEGMIEYLKGELTRKDERVRELESAAASRAKVQQNSTLRGRAGEDSFEEMAGRIGWTVERTAGESHMCDFRGVVCGLDVFFEIKNHADTIPAKELAKFRRDMKEHPEIAAGVFIGLHAAAVRGERWHLEWTGDRRPMLFIGELEKDDPVAVLKIAEKFIACYGVMRAAAAEGDDDGAAKAAGLEQRISVASTYLEATGARLRGLYNKMVVDKGAADAAYTGSLVALKGIREEHSCTVDALLGTSEFVVVAVEEPTARAASPKKRKTAAKKGAAADVS
jgi:hypothetical protein